MSAAKKIQAKNDQQEQMLSAIIDAKIAPLVDAVGTLKSKVATLEEIQAHHLKTMEEQTHVICGICNMQAELNLVSGDVCAKFCDDSSSMPS